MWLITVSPAADTGSDKDMSGIESENKIFWREDVGIENHIFQVEKIVAYEKLSHNQPICCYTIHLSPEHSMPNSKECFNKVTVFITNC